MRPVSRIMTTITAQFDQLVSQIENHEAVAEASLRNLREDIRNARFQYKMIQRDLEKIQIKQSQNEKEIDNWKDRARRYHSEDREKALHCVKRLKQFEAETTHLNQRETDLSESALHLQKQLSRVESQYQSLRNKMQSLACRDHAAQIKNRIYFSGGNEDGVNDIFERWERKITHKEVSGEMTCESVDPIGQEIQQKEEDQDIEMALEELVKQ